MKIGPITEGDTDYLDGVRAAYDSGLIVVDTPTLARWENDCPRGLNRLWLAETVDIAGLHVGERVLFHNDRDWRCQFSIKVNGTTEPVTKTVDLSMEEWIAARAAHAVLLGIE